MKKEPPKAASRGVVAPSSEQPRESAGRTAIFTALGGTLTTLLSQEFKLAKVEASVFAGLARRSVGNAGSAGVAAHLVLLSLSLGAAGALALWTGYGPAALVLAGAWSVAELTLVLLARKKLARDRGTPGTVRRESGAVPDDARARQPENKPGKSD